MEFTKLTELNHDGIYRIFTSSYDDDKKLITTYNQTPDLVEIRQPGLPDSVFDVKNDDDNWFHVVHLIFYNKIPYNDIIITNNEIKKTIGKPNSGLAREALYDFIENYPDIILYGPYDTFENVYEDYDNYLNEANAVSCNECDVYNCMKNPYNRVADV
jgi:hypothetical protein